ncbi:hypothetical protein C8J57DRAFT_1608341 [Mycena rebaudengoi]|nr:hypothetical protein C8J57DRAFT_1608341 [Mycena rebaudengoi]
MRAVDPVLRARGESVARRAKAAPRENAHTIERAPGGRAAFARLKVYALLANDGYAELLRDGVSDIDEGPRSSAPGVSPRRTQKQNAVRYTRPAAHAPASPCRPAHHNAQKPRARSLARTPTSLRIPTARAHNAQKRTPRSLPPRPLRAHPSCVAAHASPPIPQSYAARSPIARTPTSHMTLRIPAAREHNENGGQSGVARATGVRTCCMGPIRCTEQDKIRASPPHHPLRITRPRSHTGAYAPHESRVSPTSPSKVVPHAPLPARLPPPLHSKHIYTPLLGGGAQFLTASAYPSSHERASCSPNLSDTAASRHHPTRSTCTSNTRDTTAPRAVCPRARSVRKRTAGPAPWHSVGTERAASQSGIGVAGEGVRGAQGGAYGGQAMRLRLGGQRGAGAGRQKRGGGAHRPRRERACSDSGIKLGARGHPPRSDTAQTCMLHSEGFTAREGGVLVLIRNSRRMGPRVQGLAGAALCIRRRGPVGPRNSKRQEIEESASYKFHSPQRLGQSWEQVRRTSNRTKRDWSSGECRLLSFRNHHRARHPSSLEQRQDWAECALGYSSHCLPAVRRTAAALRLFSSSSPSHLFGPLLTRNLTGKKRQEGARLRTTCMLPCIVAAQMVLNTRNKAGRRRVRVGFVFSANAAGTEWEEEGRRAQALRIFDQRNGLQTICMHNGLRTTCMLPCIVAAQMDLVSRRKAGRRRAGLIIPASIHDLSGRRKAGRHRVPVRLGVLPCGCSSAFGPHASLNVFLSLRIFRQRNGLSAFVK